MAAQTGRWMIYGANGYTGELSAREAKRRGLTPVLAGRRREAVEALAAELGFEARIFGLGDASKVAEGLADIDAVLHCAGPFSATSAPMLAGCAAAGTHYTDITGEIAVFEAVHGRNAEWKAAGITAMPGVGFDVVPSDCLAAMLKRELPSATHLRMAFTSKHGRLSPGTSKTMIEGLGDGCKIRENGRIVSRPAAFKTEMIPFASGKKLATPIAWGDVSTAFYSTGIPNIEVYLGVSKAQVKQMKTGARLGWLLGMAPVQWILKKQIERKVKGPNAAERARDGMQLWGEVTDGAGGSMTIRIKTPEGYSLTAEAGVEAVSRIMKGDVPTGALTPSMAFGADFVTELTGVEVTK